jgi:hypothetical protein
MKRNPQILPGGYKVMKLYGEVLNIKGRGEHERRVVENGVMEKRNAKCS